MYAYKNTRDPEKQTVVPSTPSAACDSMILSLRNGTIIQAWDSDEPHPPNCRVVGHLSTGVESIITDHRLDNNLEFGFLSFLARGQHDSFDSATALYS